MKISAISSAWRAVRFSCPPGLQLHHSPRAPTPRRAASAFDIVRKLSSASAKPNCIQPEGLMRSLQQPMRLPTAGCAAPDLHLVRRFNSEPHIPSSHLPILTQAQFFEYEDIKDSRWLEPADFLDKYPAILNVRKSKTLIQNYSLRDLMLSGIGRKLWQSGVELVFINKLRGRDIARALVENNLLVSECDGTFALKHPISDVYDESKPFMGYKALRVLFERLMMKVYGDSVISFLTEDVQHFLDTLVDHIDDLLCLYHAALLGPSARAWLSIRLNSLFRNEVNLEGFIFNRDKNNSVVSRLPYVSSVADIENTDDMQDFFVHWRQYGKGKMAPEEPSKEQNQVVQDTFEDKSQSCKGTAQEKNQACQETSQEKNEACEDPSPEQKAREASGFWIAALNRNGVLHRVWPRHMEIFPNSFPVRKYCLWEVV